MTTVIVDTTILTDVLLKERARAQIILRTLSKYDDTVLPVYAIKEFSAGPLKNFCWMHNKLAVCGSFALALDALHKMSLSPRRYTTATAVESLRVAAGTIGSANMSSLTVKYGESASPDRVLCDEFRVILKRKIFTAWRKRRQITTRIEAELDCFAEIEPRMERGTLVRDKKGVNGDGCYKGETCAAASMIETDIERVKTIKQAVERNPNKQENQRRSSALKELIRVGSERFPQNKCRWIGDALFAFISEDGGSIMTTNLADFNDLAKSVGATVVTPVGA